MMKNRVVYLLLIVFVLMHLNTQEACAYINPGSGSDIFQMAYSSLLAIGAFFKKIFIKIAGVFCKEKTDDKYE